MAFANGEPTTSSLPSEYEALGPFLGLARELQTKTDETVGSLTEADLYAGFCRTVDEVGDQLVQTQIEKILGDMPAEQLLDLYARRFGDETVLEPLKTMAELRRKEAEREARIAIIKQEAQISRQFDFRNVPDGEIVTVGLFRPDKPLKEKSYAFADQAGRVIVGRMVDNERGFVQVIRDELTRNSKHRSESEFSNRTIMDHYKVQIGTVDRSRGILEPVVTHGSRVELYSPTENHNKFLEYDLGYILLGGIPMLA